MTAAVELASAAVADAARARARTAALELEVAALRAALAAQTNGEVARLREMTRLQASVSGTAAMWESARGSVMATSHLS